MSRKVENEAPIEGSKQTQAESAVHSRREFLTRVRDITAAAMIAGTAAPLVFSGTDAKAGAGEQTSKRGLPKVKTNLCCDTKLYSTRRAPLASNWNKRRPDGYDVVIIGSGYGGAVTAARLATAEYPAGRKPSACILERGREWLPGDFPDDLLKAALEVRRKGHELGLYDFRAAEDLNVIIGCGLGGTSLINANAVIDPDPDLFQSSEKWPQAIVDANSNGGLKTYFENVRKTLSAAKHPSGMELAKVQQMKKGAEGVTGSSFDLHTIAVNFDYEGPNNWNVAQRKCIGCGDCVTGCNVGAKNTLDTNYLAIAKNGGAEIFTQVEVQWIEKVAAGGYNVDCIKIGEWGSRKHETIVAKHILVVAAGTLGSTEIMLRSREHHLSLSDAVGHHFSGNGDYFGLAYNGDQRANILAWGAYPDSSRALYLQLESVDSPPGSGDKKIKKRQAPGPTIVSRVLYNTKQELMKRYKIEDLSFPLLFVDAARAALALLEGGQIDCGKSGLSEEQLRICRDILAQGPRLEEGALNYSMVYLVNGHDDASGRIDLCGDSVKVSWPGVRDQDCFKTERDGMRHHAETLGATLVDPLNLGIPGAPANLNLLQQLSNHSRGCTTGLPSPLVTAHPLGGCVMADSYRDGLVNHQGQVYDKNGNLHEGLYIADGAVIPTAIGVNPLLTISMLAERRAEYLIRSLGGVPKIINNIQPKKGKK